MNELKNDQLKAKISDETVISTSKRDFACVEQVSSHQG